MMATYYWEVRIALVERPRVIGFRLKPLSIVKRSRSPFVKEFRAQYSALSRSKGLAGKEGIFAHMVHFAVAKLRSSENEMINDYVAVVGGR